MLSSLIWRFFAFKKVLKFCSDHNADLHPIDGFDDETTNLTSTVDKIGVAEDIQGTVTSGVTDETDEAKIEMAETIVQMAHLGRPKAKNAGKTALVKAISFEAYEIIRAPKEVALSMARNIFNTLKDNLLVFTNIKPADITLMDGLITAYDSAQVNLAAIMTNKKVLGTEAYFDLFAAGNVAVDNMYDYIYGTFNKTNKNLVKAFKDARTIEIEGVRHTGMLATCLEAKQVKGETPFIEGVLCKIVEMNREILSDINGIGTIIKFKTGTYHVEFSKEGYVTKTMIIHFNRGEVLQVTVLMERGE